MVRGAGLHPNGLGLAQYRHHGASRLTGGRPAPGGWGQPAGIRVCYPPLLARIWLTWPVAVARSWEMFAFGLVSTASMTGSRVL